MYTIYSKQGCTFCDKAKDLLRSKGVGFHDIHLENKPHLADWLRNQGFTTVPQIYEDDTYIGGYTELAKYFDLDSK